jgi:hypothetical protein
MAFDTGMLLDMKDFSVSVLSMLNAKVSILQPAEYRNLLFAILSCTVIAASGLILDRLITDEGSLSSKSPLFNVDAGAPTLNSGNPR